MSLKGITLKCNIWAHAWKVRNWRNILWTRMCQYASVKFNTVNQAPCWRWMWTIVNVQDWRYGINTFRRLRSIISQCLVESFFGTVKRCERNTMLWDASTTLSSHISWPQLMISWDTWEKCRAIRREGDQSYNRVRPLDIIRLNQEMGIKRGSNLKDDKEKERVKITTV